MTLTVLNVLAKFSGLLTGLLSLLNSLELYVGWSKWNDAGLVTWLVES